MKLLRIIHTLNPKAGGPIESLRQSSLCHDQDGHSTEVITLDSEDEEFLANSNLEHLAIHALGPGKFGWGYSARLRSWLRSNLDRFDGVIIHGLWLYPSFGSFLELRKSTIPWVVFPHGMLDPWFQSWKRRPLKTLRNFLYWNLLERRVINNATAVLFTSTRECELASTTFKGYDATSKVIPYGTSLPPEFSEEFTTEFLERCPDIDGHSYFLYLSRIHPKKGIEELLVGYTECFKSLSNTDNYADLVIAGPGTETEYGKQIVEQVATLNKQWDRPKIYICGMLEGDAKWGAYYGSEAFVLLSHQENFGIVVAEALGCGKAVLISDQVNIYKEIEMDQAGLVETDTESGAIQLFNRWMEMTEIEKISIGTNARACFENRFDVWRSSAAIIKIFEEQIGE